MAWCPDGDKLDQEIFDAVSDFIGLIIRRGEAMAGQFGLPAFCIKAMHRLEESVSMKELGKRMHCDPSFVTMIADTLEQRGLVRREADPADRRIKNLVLTDAGLDVKAQMERTLLSEVPWACALSTSERETFLALVRTMTAAMQAPAGVTSDSEPAGGVSGTPHGVSPIPA